MNRSSKNQRPPLPRRNFLKSSGLVLAGTALPGSRTAAEGTRTLTPDREPPQSTAAPSEDANILQGTRSSYSFSRGNTLPIAAAPFGMTHWTLQSAENSSWMFSPDDRRIQSFRCTHQLSPWLADYGHAGFLPFSGSAKPEPGTRSSSWRPEESELHPNSLRVSLLRYRVEVELVPTERCALLAAAFAGKDAPGFLIDIPETSSNVQLDPSNRTVRFASHANHGGVPDNFATYYVVRFDHAWTTHEISGGKSSTFLTLQFSQDSRAVEARIATSFISYEQAERNLAHELGDQPLHQVRDRTAALWRSYTDRVEVAGGTERQRKIFNSCLYRALLFPHTWHEPDAEGKPHHYSPYNGNVLPGVMYADHGYWDVYRAWYPLMSILFPDKLGEILQSWVNAFTEGGWMPQFPCPGYRACMTGSLIDAVFADAAVKNITGFDLANAYQGLRKHATQPGDPDKGYGRRGIEDYLRLGYVAADNVSQSVAETADAAYGDFCIAQIATRLGHDADHALFLERSRNWKHLFDSETKFLRGKKQDGSWLEPFDEFQWGSPYVEGSAWQHRWDVPHDITGLIQLMDGNNAAVEALEKMLSLQPIFHVGVYGQEIHEMSEMAAVNFGQYAHSNQPVHHLLYIFAVAGRPDRTQYWTRKVLDELYSPDTFPGDEDTGSMAAWYLLSSMGFYPLCPGKSEYVLGSPIFDRITLHLAGGKTTVISARGQSSASVQVTGIRVNDRDHSSPFMSHDILTQGSRIEFTMQPHSL